MKNRAVPMAIFCKNSGAEAPLFFGTREIRNPDFDALKDL
jgi:hypothetical protein